MTVVALGLTPFLTGFVAVELLSFVFPLGGRLRRGGILGRRKLNTYTVRAGVGLALIRAFHYRSLFFFFGPIFKIELMVAAAELEGAWNVIQPEEIEAV